ncbi:hypothetical protein ACTG9Q_26025 [Actinokineospora sp. 24-640]
MRASFTDGAAVAEACAGAEVVLMVSAAESADRVARHKAFVDAASGAGHLVCLSFFSAAPDAAFTLARDHWATEQHIRARGVPFTSSATTSTPTSPPASSARTA